jgi:hypothetical protein
MQQMFRAAAGFPRSKAWKDLTKYSKVEFPAEHAPSLALVLHLFKEHHDAYPSYTYMPASAPNATNCQFFVLAVWASLGEMAW